MAESITTKSFSQIFNALPDAVKGWLVSDSATIYVSEINKKLGLKGEKVSIVPRLIMRLVVKDLEPNDFINELSGALNMNYQAAKALTQEIEAKILKPIELGLRQDAGIDLKLIYMGKPKPVEEKPASLPTAAQPKTPAPPLASIPISGREESEEAETPESEEPTLIYKKGTFGRIPVSQPKTFIPPTSGPARPIGGPAPPPPPLFTAKPPQSTPIENLKPKPLIPPLARNTSPNNEDGPIIPKETKLKVEEKKSEPQPPIKPRFTPPPPAGGPARPIGGPARPIGGAKATQIVYLNLQPTTDNQQSAIGNLQPNTRIVHYSHLLTPLNNLGLEKKPKQKKEDVILKGNTVDLRFT